MMRPSVARPTGTEIGAPVDSTARPRFRRGGAHGDGAHDPVTELLLHLEREIDVFELQRLVDLRDRFARKFHVDDCADDLRNLAGCHVRTLALIRM